jgi:hypothetical protein
MPRRKDRMKPAATQETKARQLMRLTMKMSMKLIVAAAGAVVLASPAMAGNWRTAPVPMPASHGYWGLGYRGYAHHHSYGRGNGHGYGPAYDPQAGQRGGVRQETPDCVHVMFPQCSEGGG